MLIRQRGLITVEQWRDLGRSAAALSRACERGELERVLPRVYRSTAVPAWAHDGALAAALWAGEGAVASHVTAARVLGAELPATKPHIWVPRAQDKRSKLVIVHRGDVPRSDRRVRDGIPITSPPRTLVDIAGMVDGEILEAVLEDFFRRGLTTPMSVDRCLTAVGGKGRSGSGRLRELLADRGDAALELKLEVRIWRLLRSAGLRPDRQHEVRVAGRKYRLDFAWPALKVAVEGHGFGAHGGQLAHVRDSRRLADLVGLGWRVLPVTWEAVTDEPTRVIELIRAALGEAAA